MLWRRSYDRRYRNLNNGVVRFAGGRTVCRDWPGVITAIACLFVSTPMIVAQQGKRPITINDLVTTVRVSEPELSPDTRRVLFVRTTTDLSTGKRNADIWSVATDGSSAPAALITGEKAENSPRFSPDGKKILFISTRSGDPQVFAADSDGKNIKQLTTISGGVQPPLVVSPDSRKFALCFLDVYPSCKDEACNKRTREAEEQDPVKVRVMTGLPFRHWDEWRTNVRHHVFVADLDNPQPRDITPGDFDSPTHFYEDNAVTFSPDSRSIAFVSNRDGRDREMLNKNRDVWVVPVTGGDAKKLTNNRAAYDQPTFSPDGKLLAIRSQRRAGFESDRWYLDLYDQTTGGKRTLFETPDLSVDDYAFSADGRTIWFEAQDQGRINLYTIPVMGGTPKLIVKGGAISQFRIANNFIVVAKSTLTSPTDLFRISADGASTRQLTNENGSWLSQVDAPKPEALSAPGAGGTPIQYWLVKPPNFDSTKKYPVVFMIHGGPQGAWEDGWSYRWNPMLWAAQGWIIAAPNPRGSFGFGQKFVDEISQDWCGKAMMDLTSVFDTVGKLPYVDPQRTAIAGASYGGYAVDWIIGHTNRFKAAVAHDGVFDLETMSLESEELWFTDWEAGGPPWSPAARRFFERCSPHLSADRIRTPTLVISNEQDFRVPIDQGLQLFTALRRNGRTVRGTQFSRRRSLGFESIE